MKLFITDIDGTLTDGGYYSPSVHYLTCNGERSGDFLPELFLRKFNTKDFVGIYMLHRHGIKTVALTGSPHPSQPQFDRSAPYMDIASGVQDKYEWVRSTYIDCLDRPSKCKWDDIAFIGDEINDIALLKEVGLAACPADASPEVLKIIDHHPNGFIMSRKGGELCVREFTDLIRKIDKIPASWINWKEETDV